MEGIAVVAAVPADVDRLVAMRARAEPDNRADERMRGYLEGTHHPQQALRARSLWMAMDGDAPIGYIGGHLTERYGCDGELQYLYVVPERRGGAVAAALLGRLAAWFAAQGARRVCVNVGNPRADRFYARHGAVPLRPHWRVWVDVSPLAEGAAPEPGLR